MRLEEARLGRGALGFALPQADLDPGGFVLAVAVRIALEDQLPDDLMHPGGAGFRPSTDDDVVVAHREVVPWP
jgi:hypothetical protein